MATAFKTSNHTVSVHSAFDLPSAQRVAIEDAVKETFAPDANVQFETAPEIISGIELSTNGHKIAWSIADYLANLQRSAGDLVNTETRAAPKPNAKDKPEPKAAAPQANGGARPGPKRESKPAPEPVAPGKEADH